MEPPGEPAQPGSTTRRRRTVKPGVDAEKHLQRAEASLNHPPLELKHKHSFFGSPIGVGRATGPSDLLRVDVEQAVRDLPAIPIEDSPRETVSAHSSTAGARMSAASSSTALTSVMRAVPVGSMPSPRTFEQAQSAAAAASSQLVRGAPRSVTDDGVDGEYGAAAETDSDTAGEPPARWTAAALPREPRLVRFPEALASVSETRRAVEPGSGGAGAHAPRRLSPHALHRRPPPDDEDDVPEAEPPLRSASTVCQSPAHDWQPPPVQQALLRSASLPRVSMSRSAPAAADPRLVAALRAAEAAAAYRSKALEIMREREEEIRIVRELSLEATAAAAGESGNGGHGAVNEGRDFTPSVAAAAFSKGRADALSTGPPESSSTSDRAEHYRGYGLAVSMRGTLRAVHRQSDDAHSAHSGGPAGFAVRRTTFLDTPADLSDQHHRCSHGCAHRAAAQPTLRGPPVPAHAHYSLPSPIWGVGGGDAGSDALGASSGGSSVYGDSSVGGPPRSSRQPIHLRLHASKTVAAAAREEGVVPLADLRRAAAEAAEDAAAAGLPPAVLLAVHTPHMRALAASTAASSFRVSPASAHGSALARRSPLLGAGAHASPPPSYLSPLDVQPQRTQRHGLSSGAAETPTAAARLSPPPSPTRHAKSAPTLPSYDDVEAEAAAATAAESARVPLRSPGMSPLRQPTLLSLQTRQTSRPHLGPLPEEESHAGDEASEAGAAAAAGGGWRAAPRFDFDGAGSSVSARRPPLGYGGSPGGDAAGTSRQGRGRPLSPSGGSSASVVAGARAAAALSVTRDLIRREADAQAAHDRAARDRLEHRSINAGHVGSSFVAALRSPGGGGGVSSTAGGVAMSPAGGGYATGRASSRASIAWQQVVGGGGSSSASVSPSFYASPGGGGLLSPGGAVASSRPPFVLPAGSTAAATATAGRLPGTARAQAQLIAVGALPVPSGAGAPAARSRSVLAYLPSQIVRGDRGGGDDGRSSLVDY